jgi:hypothetical protein
MSMSMEFGITAAADGSTSVEMQKQLNTVC